MDACAPASAGILEKKRMTEVVLVNELDEPTGTMEKMAAHQGPHLHRAFSVFLFNKNKQMLLQRRALKKYHSGGLWTNTCCSHPYPGEAVAIGASRRLMEEMGIETPLQKAFHFIYQADFDNGLNEYEFDHVFIGEFEGPINPDPAEVADYCYKSIADIKRDIKLRSDMYTAWFQIALPMLEAFLASEKAS
jgi:isopentenyl-diphosphate Delta-isomerase